MKFIHAADIHFDIPFTTLSDRADLGNKRRLDQRKAFKKIIECVKKENVEYLFLSGDIYENEYIKTSTIEYINDLFKEIPETKIYITPGNHDPYIKNSFYATYDWADNVKIFTNKLEKVEEKELVIYGYGFNNYEMNEKQIQDIDILDNEKINILITHGDIYTDSKYNKINLNELKIKNFDYIALGHLHKRDEYYPGSLISLGFDEPGKHGFILGEIKIINNKKILNKTFIEADEIEFIKKDIDISDIISQEELIEKLNETDTGLNLYEMNLIGNRNFEINIDYKLIKNEIIKIKNNTTVKMEINGNQNTLSGIFYRNAKLKLDKNEINEKKFEEIILLHNKIMKK